MIKKLFTVIIACLPMVASAQLSVGNWQLFPAYNGISVYNNNKNKEAFTGYRMLDTPGKVYYISEGFLYSIDKQSQEKYSYSPDNLLSDYNVKGIWYNFTNKYLFISYESGNIDLLYDNGTLVNLPDIKDAILTTSKIINDVAFDKDRIYVATSFGIVAFDDKNHYVVDSGVYNQNVESVTATDGKLLALSKDNLRIISTDKRINSWNNFTVIRDFWGNNLMHLEGNIFLSRYASGNIYGLRYWKINLDNGSVLELGWIPTAETVKSSDYITPMADGRCFAKIGGDLYIINKDLTTETYTLPASISKNVIAMSDSPASLWTASAAGVAQFDITTTPETIKNDYSLYNGTLQLKQASILKYSPSGRLYMSGLTPSVVFSRDGYWYQQNTCIYDGNECVNANALGVSVSYNGWGNPAWEFLTQYGGTAETSAIWSVYDVTEDPEDPDTYYVCTQFEGIYRLTRNSDGIYKETAVYNSSNSPIDTGYGCMVFGMAFDKFNNIWIISNPNDGSTTTSKLSFLPAAARKKATVEKSDWTEILLTGATFTRDAKIMICEKSNMIFILDAFWPTRLIAYDTKGTSSLADDKYVVIDRYVDQDGKVFEPEKMIAMAEDKNGKVWIGTQTGILEISNPTNATNPNFTFNRLKVPRKDGSGFADYLLDSQHVISIAVDGANRKWLGTLTSGVYYVTENGDEVIEHFTADNSKLPSDLIHAVECSPTDNRVFISTANGIMQYSSTTSPSAENYENVYAYPNPVRPEYTGWITITGLMDGSRVKIADSVGNVIYDTVSNGGMVTWDGCDRDGQRVRTGVYYVYASKSSSDGTGGTEGAVTKILVVN